jgi:hypothetical protein
MAERYRSAAARNLVGAIRRAGGTVERRGVGRLVVTGPGGSVTINEPSGETRRDLRRSSAGKLIEERTGLRLE